MSETVARTTGAEAGEIADRLLRFLEAELAAPNLSYSRAPVPMTGGYDTRIFQFALNGAPVEAAAPLVLRLLRERDDPARVLRERACHDAVTAFGYPAPRVLLASTDVSILGGGFMVMERVAGRPLLQARPFNVGATLAAAQVKLHALALPESLVAFAGDALTLAAYIERLRAAIDADLRGLRPAIAWVAEHLPEDGDETVLCHGDFHPYNILWDDGRLSAVLDWPNAFLGPAAADVAATKVILSYSRPARSGPLTRVLSVLRPLLIRRYLGTYRKLSGRDLVRSEPFEALACVRCLAIDGKNRLASLATPRLFDSERLIARFREITGITPDPSAGAP